MRRDARKKVFISHISEEAGLAQALKTFIESKTRRKISAFASSAFEDLTPGMKWPGRVTTMMKEASILLVICSPTSLTRRWINFEAGCAWMTDMTIIPLCHSGQRKDDLPYPFGQYQSLQLEDPNFGKLLLTALRTHLGIRQSPTGSHHPLRTKLRKILEVIAGPEAIPLIIHSPKERTRLITNDLKTLLARPLIGKETVWTSAFLSSFAIGRRDPYPPDQKEYLRLLLEERDLLLQLARKGCLIRCIISPANENLVRHTGFESALRRTKRLLRFLRSKDSALEHIDWATSELGTKNLYIVGWLSCFEGYKKGVQPGYGLTLRQTSRDVIATNVEVYNGFFSDLAARSLAKWTDKRNKETSERDLLRAAAIRCLEDSLIFLDQFGRRTLGREKRDHRRRARRPRRPSLTTSRSDPRKTPTSARSRPVPPPRSSASR